VPSYPDPSASIPAHHRGGQSTLSTNPDSESVDVSNFEVHLPFFSGMSLDNSFRADA